MVPGPFVPPQYLTLYRLLGALLASVSLPLGQVPLPWFGLLSCPGAQT